MSGDGTFFEAMGFYYIGPIDGHNIKEMIDVIGNLKDFDGRAYLRFTVVTQKGKGYLTAEESNEKYHGVSKFNIATGKQQKSSNIAKLKKQFHKIKFHKLKLIKVIFMHSMPSGQG